MKITAKDYKKFHDDKEEYYEIEYETPYSKGKMIVKCSFYNAFLNKFTKVMKDCEIRKMRMVYESI